MACVCQQLARIDALLSPFSIGNLWVFQNLQQPEVEGLVRAGRRRQFKKGQTFYMQGTAGDEVFLIMAGGVKLTKLGPEGHELILDIRRAGDFLGEHVLNREFDYPFTATCLERTLAWGFSRAAFEKLVREYPNIGLEVIRNLSRRVSRLTNQAEMLATANLEERVYRALSWVAREYGVKEQKRTVIRFPLTHEELSCLVGAHRVSVTRALKNLKDTGRIAQQGKALVLMTEEP